MSNIISINNISKKIWILGSYNFVSFLPYEIRILDLHENIIKIIPIKTSEIFKSIESSFNVFSGKISATLKYESNKYIRISVICINNSIIINNNRVKTILDINQKINKSEIQTSLVSFGSKKSLNYINLYDKYIDKNIFKILVYLSNFNKVTKSNIINNNRFFESVMNMWISRFSDGIYPHSNDIINIGFQSDKSLNKEELLNSLFFAGNKVKEDLINFDKSNIFIASGETAIHFKNISIHSNYDGIFVRLIIKNNKIHKIHIKSDKERYVNIHIKNYKSFRIKKNSSKETIDLSDNKLTNIQINRCITKIDWIK